MKQWAVTYGVPTVWIAGSIAVLWFARPVLSRFRDIAEQAERRQASEPSDRNRLASRLAQRDYRTRQLIAAVPCTFALIGILVLLPFPMTIDRIVVTILFFVVLWLIGYKFYAENRDQSWEERRLERENAAAVQEKATL